MSIHLNRIYTKFGDAGQTAIPGGTIVDKDSIICDTMGDIDELNCHIGILHTYFVNDYRHVIENANVIGKLKDCFTMIQNDLFDIGCNVSMVYADNPPLIDASHITVLEENLDTLNAMLPTLNSFVLPGGGGEIASHSHLARAVCRRVERKLVTCKKQFLIRPEALKYINRLSDFLFVYARWALRKEKGEEFLWETPLKRATA